MAKAPIATPTKVGKQNIWESLNLINLLSHFKRDNTKFSGYESDPEYYDQLGRMGIKVIDKPHGWGGGRAAAFGNKVYIPANYKDPRDAFYMLQYGGEDQYTEAQIEEKGLEKTGKRWGIEGKLLGGQYLAGVKGMVKEEIPHVAQYRNKGILGMLVDQAKSYMRSRKNLKEEYGESGTYEDVQHEFYEDPHSSEYFHGYYPEKKALTQDLYVSKDEQLPEGVYPESYYEIQKKKLVGK